jgi:hypothetical protein
MLLLLYIHTAVSDGLLFFIHAVSLFALLLPVFYLGGSK